MHFLWAASTFLAFTSASPVAVERAPSAWSNYKNNGVFYPQQNATSWRTLYARTLQLPDNSLLLSWEDYSEPDSTLTSWPIYKSTDGGVSFKPLSRVRDQVNGWGNWYQPYLYTLPQPFGGYPAGTILIAGTSTPRNLSEAYIDIYASKDSGSTWKFVSHVVYGPGPETTTNGNKAVWEPFLLMYNNQLVCYYSSQVDPAHAQKLSHKTTTDLKNWSAEVNDVAQPNYGDRPGMATVAYSPNSKKYVMTFEYCGGPLTGGCPVYHKVSTSPLNFQSITPQPLINDGSLNPNGSPYVTWTKGSNGQGVFIANGDGRSELYLNSDAADPSGWKMLDVGADICYSRALRVINTPSNSAAAGKPKLLVANGGNIGCSGSCYNYVETGLYDVPSY